MRKSAWWMTFTLSLVISTACGISLEADSHGSEGLRPVEAGGFISPDVCGQCHDELYGMWDGSLHSKAFEDPLFVAASKGFVREVTVEGERMDAEHCVACHNPIGYRSGQIKGSSADYSMVDQVTGRSISCDFCHSLSEVVRTQNALFNVEPGHGEDDPGVKRGPRDDAESMFHESDFSALHTSSRVCGVCHNVTHLWYKTKLEGTYDEWSNSPYNSADPSRVVTCQDCHMRQSAGNPSTGMTERPDYPGSSSPMGPERPHIYRHSVTGANTLTPALLGHPETAELAIERLRHAAVLEIVDSSLQKGTMSTFTVRVRNEGAGHMLPTGVTEYRQMWLEVGVTDDEGQMVYSSGVIDGEDRLPDDTRIFRTVFGDTDGQPTLNVARAAVLLTDHRIPPKGYVDETYYLSGSFKGSLTVSVALKYRSFDPAVARALLERPDLNIPVVTMAETTAILGK